LPITPAVLSYAIDEDDYLVKVDDGYYCFAEDNDWDGARSSLGRLLWDFVAGKELEKLQRMLVRRIRDEVRSVDLPFRCDGPEVRREMDIQIAARSSGRFVLFTARLRSEQQRPAPQPLLSVDSPRGKEMLTMCGWCDRFLVDGRWVEVEEAAAQLGLFRLAEMPTISHGICPDCGETLLAA
jgi:hypothetical protein